MKICLEYMGLNIYKFLISQNISADLQGPKEKIYINCTMDDAYYINFGTVGVQIAIVLLNTHLLWLIYINVDAVGVKTILSI